MPMDGNHNPLSRRQFLRLTGMAAGAAALAACAPLRLLTKVQRVAPLPTRR